MFVEFDKNPSPKTLKKFGQTFAGIVALVCIILYGLSLFSANEAEYKFLFLLMTTHFLAFAFFKPEALKSFYIFWNYLGAAIGFVVGPIVLTVFYYGVLTPLAVLSRLTGKKWLNTATQESYWTPLEKRSKDQFEKLF